MKVSFGYIKNLEKEFLKYLKNEYCVDKDEKLWCNVCDISVDTLGKDALITFKVFYGKISEKYPFNKSVEICTTPKESLKFILGRFAQAIYDLEYFYADYVEIKYEKETK